ncbi:MAG: type III-A CRISPR-associated RAMP protein Csm3 [Planctomycetes bacterium]|nr:type III-A CRISPR-associated RAMP protein Csm3 [Planctomycetota bacterium]
MKKLRSHMITGSIVLKTGLRIGGSDDLLQIGGTDLTCIKHSVTLQPYIPGSSLKGKLRCELERCHGLFSGRDGNEPYSAMKPNTDRQIRKPFISKTVEELLPHEYLVAAVFGPHKNAEHALGPTRIIVRDAGLRSGGEIETKTENIIDRKVGTAQHPRKVERVVAGSRFALEIVLHEWDIDGQCSYSGKSGGEALVEFVKHGLREVRNTGLGSGVSRGSGQVDFEELKWNGEAFSL